MSRIDKERIEREKIQNQRELEETRRRQARVLARLRVLQRAVTESGGTESVDRGPA